LINIVVLLRHGINSQLTSEYKLGFLVLCSAI